jgi:carbon-monoxide dehydrogenase medium subunit
MIPQDFDYTAARTLQEALTLVGEGAKPLAGGMSLVPLMKLRLAAPERVVDLARVPGLNFIREEGAELRIGATTTHYEIESSALVRSRCPLLAETAGHIGDIQVRNQGTIGGSIAHADPAADYPAALLALEARLRLASAGGERTLPIEEFLVDPFTTALNPGEIIVEVILPAETPKTGVRYAKMAHPASGFAVVGAAARLRAAGGRITFARVGITGVSGKAYRVREAERLLEGGASVAEAAAAVSRGVEANADLHASAEYRLRMAEVYAARALNGALAGTV